uniref:Dermaseptin-5 n=2 Tax=Phyllomedusa TaxID=8392 RepID=DMS5_PHYTS|nr:RecName: Full=Dermaseptin-5.1TR [Phyllomedusa trinitatis]P84925.1 RecName: Full=Dermaseptin-5; Short=DStar 05 [Phyllomedusa tarsius]
GLWSKIKEAAKTAGKAAMGFVNEMV